MNRAVRISMAVVALLFCFSSASAAIRPVGGKGVSHVVSIAKLLPVGYQKASVSLAYPVKKPPRRSVLSPGIPKSTAWWLLIGGLGAIGMMVWFISAKEKARRRYELAVGEIAIGARLTWSAVVRGALLRWQKTRPFEIDAQRRGTLAAER